MPIKDFTEKNIRNKIKSKISPEVKKRRSKHEKGKIYLDGKMVAIVKIPNAHNRKIKHSKSKYIAVDLKLTDDQFNDLINCPLSGKEYYKILAEIGL